MHSATPEGYPALQALRDRMLGLEKIAAQRRDEFIRSQPAFSEDVRAGRQSLVSGYLVWALSEGKWWPAQIYTPCAYLRDYLKDHYSHFIAKEIVKSTKPDHLFVVYLGQQRQFEWAAWRLLIGSAAPHQRQQPRICVHDFRKHHCEHRASVIGAAVLKALQEAEDTLNTWLGASGEQGYARYAQQQPPRPLQHKPTPKQSGEDPIPLSPREPPLAYRTTSGTSLAETEAETETETVAMQTTTELRVTSDGETHTAVRWRPTGGATHSTVPEDETDSAVASEEEATDQASDHDLGAADGDVAAVLRDAARELLAQFAQRVQQSLAAADSVEERQRESQRHTDPVAVGDSKRKQGGGGARWTPSSEVPSYR